MVQRCVIAALLQIEICLRRVRYQRTNAEELVFGAPEIIEPNIRVSVLVEHSRKVSFALEAPVKVWRGQSGGAKFDDTKFVGRCQLNTESNQRALVKPANDRAEILAAKVNRIPAIAR